MIVECKIRMELLSPKIEKENPSFLYVDRRIIQSLYK